MKVSGFSNVKVIGLIVIYNIFQLNMDTQF